MYITWKPLTFSLSLLTSLIQKITWQLIMTSKNGKLVFYRKSQTWPISNSKQKCIYRFLYWTFWVTFPNPCFLVYRRVFSYITSTTKPWHLLWILSRLRFCLGPTSQSLPALSPVQAFLYPRCASLFWTQILKQFGFEEAPVRVLFHQGVDQLLGLVKTRRATLLHFLPGFFSGCSI